MLPVSVYLIFKMFFIDCRPLPPVFFFRCMSRSLSLPLSSGLGCIPLYSAAKVVFRCIPLHSAANGTDYLSCVAC